ncbi:bifunctional adenosylcobinamide kinase/adenosylcobinamide-phosphate guanylyltransferase [Cytobacillus horneckiae]|uniref:bifunctional adenosylcobinamide kinase/adenosylcobinamide-phosphate guanylyltransferase n=1 Tax=Cytobacillus horneckiae TaxID=549687 RepID=UPI003D9AA24A
MHFITGGSFNGKAKWVCEQYGVNKFSNLWISAFKGSPMPNPSDRQFSDGVIVFEGIEYWVEDLLIYSEQEQILTRWREFLQGWQEWEKEHIERKVVLIGTDITKGIVPIGSDERKRRDVTGRVFQMTAKASSQMDLIWYGISQKIK